MNDIEIKATLHEILEGKIVINKKVYSIKYLHDLEAIEQQPQPETLPQPVIEPVIITRNQHNKGKVLAKTPTIDINENVYIDIIYCIKKQFTLDKILKDILSPYYPGAKEKSLKTYYRRYLQFVREWNPELIPFIGESHTRTIKKSVKKEQTEKGKPDKGKVIGKDSFLTYYENIAHDIKIAIEKEKSKQEIADTVMEKYYPAVMKKTKLNYASRYMKFVIKREDRKRPPENAYGYSKKYHTYVTPEEVKEVKKAILYVAYDYKPTSKNIIKQSKLKYHRAMAVLSILKNQRKISRTMDDKGDFVYKWIENEKIVK